MNLVYIERNFSSCEGCFFDGDSQCKSVPCATGIWMLERELKTRIVQVKGKDCEGCLFDPAETSFCDMPCKTGMQYKLYEE